MIYSRVRVNGVFRENGQHLQLDSLRPEDLAEESEPIALRQEPAQNRADEEDIMS